MKSENDNKMYFIAILLLRKILKSRICEKIIANCEEWYRKVGSRICEIANCESRELRRIPVLHNFGLQNTAKNTDWVMKMPLQNEVVQSLK